MRCEVVDATVDPLVYVRNDYSVPMVVSVDTNDCDPDDTISVLAVVAEAQVPIVTLHDSGAETDSVAGDGIYERTMLNPFGPNPSGDGFIRFSPCDPDCRGPVVEVDVVVEDPEPL